MSDYKEFQGKNLDEAIQTACSHFRLERGKLEIEILSGGSTGIFGLVGVKKASIKARPRGKFENEPAPVIQSALAPDDAPRATQAPLEPASENSSKPGKPHQERSTCPERSAAAPASLPNSSEADEEDGPQPGNRLDEPPSNVIPERPEFLGDGRSRRFRSRWPQSSSPHGEDETQPVVEGQPRADGRMDDVPLGPPPSRLPRGERRPRQGRAENQAAIDNESLGRGRHPRPRKPRPEHPLKLQEERTPAVDLSAMDQEKLESCVRQTTSHLLELLVESPKLTVRIKKDKVEVSVESEDASGIIIGREGQTLAALQYLATRIVSRLMDANIRIQIDSGDYREQQNEKLRRLAEELAAKAVATGRIQSTRPLSSYHRRVVHLTLQDREDVSTRSKGEGPQKRVLILPKRRGDSQNVLAEAATSPAFHNKQALAAQEPATTSPTLSEVAPADSVQGKDSVAQLAGLIPPGRNLSEIQEAPEASTELEPGAPNKPNETLAEADAESDSGPKTEETAKVESEPKR